MLQFDVRGQNMLKDTEIDISKIQPIVQSFMTAYANKPEDISLEEFTADLMAIELPEMSHEDIKLFCAEISKATETFNGDYQSINTYCRDGRNKNQWLYKKILEKVASKKLQLTESNILVKIEEQSHALNICNCKIHNLLYSKKTIEGLFKSISREFRDQLKSVVAPELKAASKNIQEATYLLGKNAAWSGIGTAVVSAAFYFAQKKANKEEIKTEEAIETALTSGSDMGIKVATAAAIKVSLEKGMIPILAKSTPAGVITNIACVGIENLKIVAKYSQNKINALEAMNNIAKTSITMFYGLSWSTEGAALGATFFSFFPIVGTVVGSIFGGMVGYIAGDTFGEGLYAGAQKLFDKAKTFANITWNCLCAKEKQEMRLSNELVQYQKLRY